MYSKPYHKGDLGKKSILVTGGAGFIGSNLVEYLLKYGARKVRVLDNFSTGFLENLEEYRSNSSFELINGDIRDINVCRLACEGIDIVLHQAALGSVPRSIKDPITTHQANADGFLNMLDAARTSGIIRFVYASSSSVYGDNPAMPKKEPVIGKPLSPYAVSKRINEMYATIYGDIYGMEVIGLRYFNVFGPRQSPQGEYAAVIPLFMNAVRNNQSPVIFGDGTQTRDFTFVENVVQANVLAASTDKQEAFNKIYNIAFGEGTSVNQLSDMICSFESTDLKAGHREARKGDMKNSIADTTLAREILSFDPLFSLKEGLRITYDWFKNYNS